MALPPDSKDEAAPVVLQEPQRGSVPQWDQGFTLRPEEAGLPGLHPGWAAVLPAGEVPLWQGRPMPDPRGAKAWSFSRMVFIFIALVLMMNAGFSPGLLPLLIIGYVIFRIWRSKRSAATVAAPDQIYLLTNRAAYVARRHGEALVDLRAFPITPTSRPGYGPRAVTFATRPDGTGAQRADGFLDIPDAPQVQRLIRDLQKGQT